MSEDEQLKSMITYENITRYSDSEYRNALVEFRCYDHAYFKMLLRIIYYANMGILKIERTQPKLFDDYSCNFRFYFDKQLERTCAAVSIQKWWRGAKTIKDRHPPPHVIIRNNRSATLIKHFYRNLEYQHRTNFNMKLEKYLKEFT